ncbi:hypothetical protein FB451DRAFT_1387453 [Mycena latifolia]|nr:hypothetical protein FB451DRAFT_1387453 [Mycena latifolia]
MNGRKASTSAPQIGYPSRLAHAESQTILSSTLAALQTLDPRFPGYSERQPHDRDSLMAIPATSKLVRHSSVRAPQRALRRRRAPRLCARLSRLGPRKPPPHLRCPPHLPKAPCLYALLDARAHQRPLAFPDALAPIRAPHAQPHLHLSHAQRPSRTSVPTAPTSWALLGGLKDVEGLIRLRIGVAAALFALAAAFLRLPRLTPGVLYREPAPPSACPHVRPPRSAAGGRSRCAGPYFWNVQDNYVLCCSKTSYDE